MQFSLFQGGANLSCKTKLSSTDLLHLQKAWKNVSKNDMIFKVKMPLLHFLAAWHCSVSYLGDGWCPTAPTPCQEKNLWDFMLWEAEGAVPGSGQGPVSTCIVQNRLRMGLSMDSVYSGNKGQALKMLLETNLFQLC